MLCSIIVEKKNNNQQDKKSVHFNNAFCSEQICRADLYQYVQSITSKWAKAKPKSQNLKSSAGSKKNKWSSEDDLRLHQAVLKFGVDNWKTVSLVVPGRTGKQCRERWLTHMCPNVVHSEWSLMEDLILIQKQKDFGNKWSLIAKFLPGRSSSSVKNRWCYLCRRDIPAHSEEYEKMANTLFHFQNAHIIQQGNIQNPMKIDTFEPNYVVNNFKIQNDIDGSFNIQNDIEDNFNIQNDIEDNFNVYTELTDQDIENASPFSIDAFNI